MKRALLLILTFTLSICFLSAQDLCEKRLEEKMEEIWQATSKTHFSPKTNLFYTNTIEKLTSPEDMKQLKPLRKDGTINDMGGGSGIEDCSMMGGIILAGLCDAYSVTNDQKFADRARIIASGLILADTVHGEAGFVARGVSPVDCKTIYPATSRDQYTHNVHGLWSFFHSKIATKKQKEQIRQIFCDIAEKMKRDVRKDTTPPYSFRQFGGLADSRGVAKMRDVYPHEAARLAMMYAAAYDVSKNKKYLEYYNELFDEATTNSAKFTDMPENYYKHKVPAYSIAQMMASLDLIKNVEPDYTKKKIISTIMDNTAKFADKNKRYHIYQKSIRDSSEILFGQQLADNYNLSIEYKKYLIKMVERISPKDCSSAYTLLGAYWKARLKDKSNKR